MGHITSIRRPVGSDSCVVGDHVYLVLSQAELIGIINALHSAGQRATERRLAKILLNMPGASNGTIKPRAAAYGRLANIAGQAP